MGNSLNPLSGEGLDCLMIHISNKKIGKDKVHNELIVNWFLKQTGKRYRIRKIIYKWREYTYRPESKAYYKIEKQFYSIAD